MRAKWTKLPHCQYMVYSPCAYESGYEVDCGKPASYLAQWGDKQKLYLCEDHAADIEEDEEFEAECDEVIEDA